MALSERLKQRRVERGLTSAKLASEAGISRAYVSEIESGRADRPSAAVLMKLSTALGTTIADLLERDVPAPTAHVSKALERFASQEGLTSDDVTMLAQIRFRGRQPVTETDWRFLWESIKRSIPSDTTPTK